MRHATFAQKQLGLRIHAMAFVVGIIASFMVNFFVGPPYWAFWVLLGWGIGLLSHFLCLRYFDGHGVEVP